MSSCRGSFLNLTGTNRTNLVLNDVGTAYSHFQLVQLLRSVDTLDEVCYPLCFLILVSPAAVLLLVLHYCYCSYCSGCYNRWYYYK
jgi:hypothetical protein